MDYVSIVMTGVFLFTYVMVVNTSLARRGGTRRCRLHFRTKTMSATMGTVAALLGYGGGVGLCYLLGLKHTSTANATPFLVLGVGVDDIFVIMNSYSLTYQLPSGRQKVAVAMKDCGLSITIT
eukprot:Polyplicarium_translucidae@DN5126_c0_g1_i1.p3